MYSYIISYLAIHFWLSGDIKDTPGSCDHDAGRSCDYHMHIM